MVDGDWQWVRPSLSLGFCLTVARDRRVPEVADILEIDPDDRPVLPWPEAVEEFGFDEPVARIGVAGAWSFVWQEPGAEAGARDVLTRLAEDGGEALTVWRTANALSVFGQARDGELLVEFELLRPEERTGADPDLLVPLMRQVGLDRAGAPDPVPAALRMLTELTGVLLDRQTVDAPLLTGVVRV
ncbi:DUF6461 domain-containing protein [Actinoplanes sp. NPDC051861]|uniref:DUF6461 domain-containing protein n=1 Tax=Actinoplanes sp. NPDC051861 TaxID=3155170 RepID=UPI003431F04A